MFKYGKKRPQGATRAAPKTNTPSGNITPQGGLPSWLLVGFGASVGVVIASGLFMWQPWQPVKTKKEEATAFSSVPNTPTASKTDTTVEPKFDFYDLLPNQKVTTTQAPPSETATTPAQPAPTVETKAEKPEKPSDKSVNQLKTKQDAVKKDSEKTKEKTQIEKEKALAKQKAEAEKARRALEAQTTKDSSRYTLQAGSFKNKADADRRRATAALSGLPVKVQKVTVKEGEEWYRVVVGPFTGKENTKEARQTLQSEGIDSLMIKQN